MKIGTFFSQVELAVENGEAKTIEEVLSKYVPYGLSLVDIESSILGEKYATRELLRRLKSSGVSVGSVFHPVVFNHKEKDAVEKLLDDTKKYLSYCAELECGVYMAVPIIKDDHASDEERKACLYKVCSYFDSVVSCAKEYNIIPSFENYSSTKFPYSLISDISYILQETDMNYVLDTGNFWFGGTDSLEAAKMFAKNTVHLHLKDILPKEDGVMNICGRRCDCVAIGSGIMPFKEIFDELFNVGYKGNATIEINDRRDLIKKTEASLDFLKNINIL